MKTVPTLNGPERKKVPYELNFFHFENFLSFAEISKCSDYCLTDLTQDSNLSQMSHPVL